MNSYDPKCTVRWVKIAGDFSSHCPNSSQCYENFPSNFAETSDLLKLSTGGELRGT